MNTLVKLITLLCFLVHMQIYASDVSFVFSFAEAERWDAQQGKWVPSPKKQKIKFTANLQKVTKRGYSGTCHFVNEDLFVDDAEIPAGERIRFNVVKRASSSKGLQLALMYAGMDMEGYADMNISIQYTNEKKTKGKASIDILHTGRPKYRNVKVKITRANT